MRRAIVRNHRRGDDLTHEHFFDSLHRIISLDREHFCRHHRHQSTSNLFQPSIHRHGDHVQRRHEMPPMLRNEQHITRFKDDIKNIDILHFTRC